MNPFDELGPLDYDPEIAIGAMQDAEDDRLARASTTHHWWHRFMYRRSWVRLNCGCR